MKPFLRLALLSCLAFNAIDSTAQQLVEVPLESNPLILEYRENNSLGHSRNNQVCSLDTLMMPFFEDFSGYNYHNQVYPDCAKWQDNHVFVNKDMAYNPPSVGVATFDGLAPTGKPYNQNASTNVGSPADTLTSQFINLGGKTASDAIFLSFFYQKQGLGDRPEVQDSFILEFKDTNNVWVRVWSVPGISNTVSSQYITPFEQQYIALNTANFLYNGFQFRFRNLAAITGNNDHWHLDYVFLNENRTNNADTLNANYGRYNDVAFTHRPTTPLKNGYTAMPWRHFDNATAWSNNLIIQNYNHNDLSGVGTLDRKCEVNEISPNTTSLLTELIPAIPLYSSSPNNNDSLNYSLVNSYGTLNPTGKTILESTYTIINPASFQSNPIFFNNDTVASNTVLDDYFAYDDGTAETRIIAQGLGTKIAVEFVAEVADTIQGVYFHLPYFTDRDAQLDFVNVKVWLDTLTDATEVFSRDLHRLQYRGGFNGFYFVDLVDFAGTKFLVPVQAGQKFYVGWQQSFGPNVPVGFDRSTDASAKTWVGVGSNWTQSTTKGSVMIRPVLSPDTNFVFIPIKVIENDNATVNQLKVYPNPTKHLLNLELDNEDNVMDYTVLIHNAVGQEVFVSSYQKQLDLNNYQAGLYILSIRDEKGILIAQKKVIKE